MSTIITFGDRRVVARQPSIPAHAPSVSPSEQQLQELIRRWRNLNIQNSLLGNIALEVWARTLHSLEQPRGGA